MASRLTTVLLIATAMLGLMPAGRAQQPAPGQSNSSGSSSSTRHTRKAVSGVGSGLDAGSVSNGVYRNPGFGFACKIPAGWVLRTEEMNERANSDAKKDAARVLLAAFSRPPAARGEDVN